MSINAGIINLFTEDERFEAETVSDTEVRLWVPKTSPLYENSHVTIPSKVDLWSHGLNLDNPGEPLFFGTFTVVDVTFTGWENLESVTLPSTMKISGHYKECKKLKTINLPNNVVTIPSNAFWGCESLEKVSFSSKLESIETWAFKGCVNLKSVSLSSCSSLKEIGYEAFAETGIENITLPNNLETIGQSAFSNCDKLEYIKLNYRQSKLQTIDSGAFDGCSSLRLIDDGWSSLSVAALPQKLDKINTHAFRNCAFSELILPDNLKSIETGAFENCTNLKSISFPKMTEYIGIHAFRNCESLETIYLPASITTLGQAFGNCLNIKKVYSHRIEPIALDRYVFESSVYENATLYVHETSPYKNTKWWSLFKHIKDMDGSYEYLSFKDDITAQGNGRIVIDPDKEYDLGAGYKLEPLFPGETIRNELKTVDIDLWVVYSELVLRLIPDKGEKIEKVLLAYKPSIEYMDVTNAIVSPSNEGFVSSSEGYELHIRPKGARIIVTFSGDNSPEIKDGDPYVVFNDGTLTFYYDDQRSSSQGITYDLNEGEDEPGWHENAHNITKVVFDPSFVTARPTSGHEWFDECFSLTDIEGLEYLNTSEMTFMDEMFFFCGSLKNVDLSHFNTSKVTNMRAMFSGCSGLTSIDLSHFDTSNVERFAAMLNGCRSVTEIDLSCFDTGKAMYFSYLFMGCTSLKEVKFGSSFLVSEAAIVDNAFEGCTNLKTVTFTGDIPTSINSKFFEGVGTAASPVTLAVPELYKANYLAKFNGNMFYGGYFTLSGDGTADLKDGDSFVYKTCEGVDMKFKVISASGKTIQVGTGEENASAIDKDYEGNVTIPDEINGFTVDEIGYNAFVDCKFSNIVFPSTLTTIDGEALLRCMSLKSIFIPRSVKSIAPAAFASCTAVESIVVEEGNEAYDSREGCNAIIISTDNVLLRGCKTTVIPSGIESILFAAFQWTPLEGGLTIPEGVTNIGQAAFYHTTMKSVSLPSTLIYIGGWSFQDCDGLESIGIPNGVTYIGDYAFSFCDNLNVVTIPASVTQIGEKAFNGNDNLNVVVSYITEPNAIADDVFMNNNDFTNATLYVPFGTKAIYEATDGWKNFKNIVELNAKVGDVTGDGNVSKDDIKEVETVILEPSEEFNPNMDVNHDGVVNVADIVITNNIINK